MFAAAGAFLSPVSRQVAGLGWAVIYFERTFFICDLIRIFTNFDPFLMGFICII
jgi:hypothetical protein